MCGYVWFDVPASTCSITDRKIDFYKDMGIFIGNDDIVTWLMSSIIHICVPWSKSHTLETSSLSIAFSILILLLLLLLVMGITKFIMGHNLTVLIPGQDTI